MGAAPTPRTASAVRAAAAALAAAALATPVALASGFATFTADDTAEVAFGGSVAVLTNGQASVLANDFDLEGDPLTAVLHSGPQHGTLTLNPDGTFLYVHNGTRQREDHFRYQAFDGTRYSRITNVTIAIAEPGISPQILGQAPLSMTSGGSLEIKVTDLVVSDPDSTFPDDFTLAVDPGPGYAVQGTTITADPAFAGTLNVPVRVSDGQTPSPTFNLLVLVEPPPARLSLAAAATPNPATVAVAPSWTLSVTNSGGSASDAGRLTARFLSSAGPLNVSAPPACSATGNATADVSLECALDPVAPGATASVIMQTTQQAPGDVALVARLTGAGEGAAAASLNLAGSFGDSPLQLLEGAASALETGDLDGDGAIDLVAAGEPTRVFFNNGDRSFAAAEELDAASAADGVALVDWNGDGLLDIAAGGRGKLPARIFVNDGQRGFAPGAELPVANVRAAAAADVDGDGRHELVLAGDAGTAVVETDGKRRLAHGSPARAVTAGDLNGDGRHDLAVVDAVHRVVHVLTSTGNAFELLTLNNAGSVASATVADFDGDGAPDLLLAVDGADLQPPTNVVARNLGNGPFERGAEIGRSSTTQLLAGDVNGDGLRDLVVINATGSHQTYLGNTQGGLDLQGEFVLSPHARHGKLVDMDGDGHLDLLLAGVQAPSIEVYRNDGLGRFGPGDVTPPVITLIGEPTVSVKVGTPFSDPGAVATDDVEGDLTARISVDNPVDPAVVGTYTITYAVTDRSGNAAQPARRTVNVQPETEATGGGGGATGALGVLLLALAAALRGLTARAARPGGSNRAGRGRRGRPRSTRSSRR